MSVHVRADAVPVAQRLDYWRSAVAEHFGPMEVRLDEGPDHRDRIVAGNVGALRVVESTTGPGEVRRTATHTRLLDDELYQLFVQVDGAVVGEQGRRVSALSPGDLSLVDLSRPIRCVHSARHAVAVGFPPALLPLPRDDVARVLGERIPGDRGSAALVSTLVRELPRHLDEEDAAEATRLGTSVVDLLGVALAARLDRVDTVPPEARQHALLLRIYAFVEEHLGDPGLTPAAIADAHHISLRYLHKLFAGEAETVAGFVRRRRLERCRRDLLDPALAARPVSAIAARHGFASAAHFNRAFREAYGMPPGEFRAIHARLHPENRIGLPRR